MLKGGRIGLKKKKKPLKKNWHDFTPSLQRWSTTGAFSSEQYCSGGLECQMQFCEQFPLCKG